jgi:hypothetical protein
MTEITAKQPASGVRNPQLILESKKKSRVPSKGSDSSYSRKNKFEGS